MHYVELGVAGYQHEKIRHCDNIIYYIYTLVAEFKDPLKPQTENWILAGVCARQYAHYTSQTQNQTMRQRNGATEGLQHHASDANQAHSHIYHIAR